MIWSDLSSLFGGRGFTVFSATKGDKPLYRESTRVSAPVLRCPASHRLLSRPASTPIRSIRSSACRSKTMMASSWSPVATTSCRKPTNSSLVCRAAVQVVQDRLHELPVIAQDRALARHIPLPVDPSDAGGLPAGRGSGWDSDPTILSISGPCRSDAWSGPKAWDACAAFFTRGLSQ